MVRSRRTFAREFKIEAVRMVEKGDRTVREVAEQLGIHTQLLYRWCKALITEQEDAFPGQGNVSSNDEELRRLHQENARLREEREILRKSHHLLRQRKQVKFRFIQENAHRFRINVMCAALDVSRSGYYAGRNRCPSRLELTNQELLKQI